MVMGLDRESLDLAIEAFLEFARDNLDDEKLLELDERDEFPEALVREMCGELGIQLLFIEEEYGGMGGGAFDVYRICETLASVDLGVATGVLATFLGSDPIHFGGTEAQKKRWLGRIAEEGLLMAEAAGDFSVQISSMMHLGIPLLYLGDYGNATCTTHYYLL